MSGQWRERQEVALATDRDRARGGSSVRSVIFFEAAGEGFLLGVFTSPVFSSTGVGGEKQSVMLMINNNSGHVG